MKRDRLPPGQRLIEDFPVLHYGPVPEIDISRWTFHVTGLVHNPISLKFHDFMNLPSIESRLIFIV